PAVAEAAVIAVPHARWQERPLAVVLFKPGQTATADELRAFLAPGFAKWWLPDAFEFVTEIPKTAAGKFRKTALRERFATAREMTPASCARSPRAIGQRDDDHDRSPAGERPEPGGRPRARVGAGYARDRRGDASRAAARSGSARLQCRGRHLGVPGAPRAERRHARGGYPAPRRPRRSLPEAAYRRDPRLLHGW